MRSILLGCAIVVLACGAPRGAWAGPARPALNIVFLDTSKPHIVRMYLTDLDSNLAPIKDRKPQYYRLLVDGTPQVSAEQSKFFYQLNEPVALTFVVQVSPALRDALAEAVEAAKRLIDRLPAKSKVGLIAYTDVVVQDVKPGNPASAKEAIDGLRVREDALEVNVPDAIKDAIEAMDSAGLPRHRILVILSDGLTRDMNLSSFSELGRRAQDKGVTVHAIGFAPVEPDRLRTLHELSKRGGGTMRETKDAEGVTRAFDALAEEIRSQVVLTYRLPTFFDGKLHDFQIETPGGQVSNIVPAELQKAVAQTTSGIWYRSTWFLVAMIGLAQGGLILLFVLLFKWKRRPAPGHRAPPRQSREWSGEAASGRVARADEDEEEDEEEEDEEGGRAYHREDDEESDEEYTSERERLPRIREEPRSSERPERSERSERGDRSTRRGSREVRPLESRGPAQNYRRDDDSPEPSGKSRSQRRNLEALLNPVPSLLDSGPDQPSLLDSNPDHPAFVGPPMRPPQVQQPAAVNPPQGSFEAPEPLLLPDPEEFLGREASSSGAAEMDLALPDPEDFMRQVRGNEPSRSNAAAARGGTARGKPTVPNPVEQRPAPAERGSERLAPSERGSERLSSPSVSGSGIPLALVPVALPPEAGAAPGRMLDRKTKVIAVEELDVPDFVAWIVPLDRRPYVAVMVEDGFSIGGSGAAFTVSSSWQGVLRLDSRGFRIELTGDRGETLSQPLADDVHFRVGDVEFLFKVASRAIAVPLAAARLEVLEGMDQGRKIALPENEVVTLGSDATCDLVVRGEGVEPAHAIATRRGQLCTVSDLGTPSGIGYLGQQIGFRKLRPWEEVQIGTIRVVFIIEDWSGDNGGHDDAQLHDPEVPRG